MKSVNSTKELDQVYRLVLIRNLKILRIFNRYKILQSLYSRLGILNMFRKWKQISSLQFLTEDTTPRNRLVYGVERFLKNGRAYYGQLLRKLASEQRPHTLFSSC